MAIKCSSGHESPDGAAFCDECGEPLSTADTVAPTAKATPAAVPAVTQVCPSCGTANPASETFCSQCGSSLLGGPVPVESVQPVQAVSDSAVAAAPAANAVAVAVRPRLIVESDNQEFDLSGRDNVTIGRQDIDSFPDIDLLPHGGDDGYVSRLHARIFVQNGQYMIEDEHSTNFTFVNRQRIAPKTPVPIHDNDVIRLGKVQLRFKTA
ncbi:MAG TPA: FHA domain-containing protein [Ktedonobacteraceae bacterium]|nr:FHA domain-containing protein [Ktedonobacteraceae bacterium]